VTVACLAVAFKTLWPRTWPTPATSDDDDDEGDRVLAVEKQLRLLQGRLNRLAPPRAGTGEPSTEPEIVAPAGSQGHGIPTRGQVLAEYRRRRGQ